jgi:CspA family cold shock protein
VTVDVERRPEEMKEVGTVKWFNDAKGYGFIEREGGGDVFVHHTAIQADGFRTLGQGERVEFEITQGPKGLAALNVRRG